MLARLLPADPARRARRLATGLAVATGLAIGLHRVDPALPFPLFEAWALAGAVGAAILALPLPSAARRLGALVVAALLLRAGLPGTLNATFPWIELGRARIGEWEDVALLGLLAALAATARSLTSGEKWAARVASLLAVAALGVTLLLPIKSSFQGLAAAAPGMTTVPVLAWGGPVEQRWTRTFTEGTGLALFAAHVRDEWALMDIAGGIHQQAAGGEALAAVRGPVRFAAWRGLQGVAAVAHGLRALAFPVAVALFGVALVGRSLPAALNRAARGLLLAALLVVPVANLAALALGVLVWLPDDGALRLPALASTLAMLALVGLVAATAPHAGEGT